MLFSIIAIAGAAMSLASLILHAAHKDRVAEELDKIHAKVDEATSLAKQLGAK